MSTNELIVKVTALINGQMQEYGSIYDPVSIPNSAEVFSQGEVSVADSTATTVLSLSTAPKLIIIQPSGGSCQFAFSSATAADNSAVVVPDGYPFILYTSTLAYDNTLALRVDNAAANITAISAYQTSGSAIKVKTWVAG